MCVSGILGDKCMFTQVNEGLVRFYHSVKMLTIYLHTSNVGNQFVSENRVIIKIQISHSLSQWRI